MLPDVSAVLEPRFYPPEIEIKCPHCGWVKSRSFSVIAAFFGYPTVAPRTCPECGEECNIFGFLNKNGNIWETER